MGWLLGIESRLAVPQTAANLGVVIYTISLGTETNESLMQQIADDSGGKHYNAPDSSQLQSIYEEIRSQITSYNLQLDTWQED